MTIQQRPDWYSEPCFLGIDEAGRGPVLGPMVYACAYAPIAYRDQLAKQAYADSKTLNEDKREILFETIQQDSQISCLYDALSAADISVNMLSRDRISLNSLANESTFKLLNDVVQMGVNLQEVFVDTVGDAAKWQARLESKYPGVRFVVCPKADAIYPIVSAASIVAKVTRDRGLRDFVIREEAIAGGQDYGSGYPGDPVTIRWLEANVKMVFGYSDVVRFSWQTTTRLLEDAACKVQWENEAEDPGQHTLTFTTNSANVNDRAQCDMSQGNNAEPILMQQPVPPTRPREMAA
ncbi:hypothetical protein WJX77_001826 [Trebouxia sp. C0004]